MNQSNFPIYPLLYAAPISFYANWFQYNGCMDGFEKFQKQTHRNRLWEFNLDIHHVILACLQSNSETCFTTEFIPLTNGDYRKVYSSKKVHPHSDEFPTYQQVFSYDKNFEPDLSIMDLIFNLGPEATDYLCHLKV